MLLSNIILANVGMTFSDLQERVNLEQQGVVHREVRTTYDQYADHDNGSSHEKNDTRHTKADHDNDLKEHIKEHKEGTGHDNSPGRKHYNNPHDNYNKYKHMKDGVGSKHWKIDRAGDNFHYSAHANDYVESTAPKRTITGHSRNFDKKTGHLQNDWIPYSYGRDRDYGFNHVNFVPSRVRFNIDPNEMIRGVTEIQFYAYDHNKSGHGSQDYNSKDVRYTVRIRKLRNKDGSGSPSAWRDLVSGTSSTGLQLNTLDPLGLGGTPQSNEGIYEIAAFAFNPTRSENGVTQSYIGETSSVVFVIQQNFNPVITITNPEEFVLYTFGDAFKRYTMHGDDIKVPYEDMDNRGITVKVRVSDKDLGDFHKVLIRDESGSFSYPVTLDEAGTDPELGTLRVGSVSIPWRVMTGGRTNVEFKLSLVVECEDFKDSSFTTRSGSRIVSRHVVSDKPVDSNPLDMIIDLKPADIGFKPLRKYFSEEDGIRFDLRESQWSAGIERVWALVEKDGVQLSDWQLLWSGEGLGVQMLNEKGESETAKPTYYNENALHGTRFMTEEGVYHVSVRTEDRVGNISEKRSEPMKIAPITAIVYNVEPYADGVIPASETFRYTLEIDCFVELRDVVLRSNIYGGTTTDLVFTRVEGTSMTGTQVFECITTVPETQIDTLGSVSGSDVLSVDRFDADKSDPDYNFTDVKSLGSLRVFTPLDLALGGTPTIVVGKETLYVATTTKYVNRAEIKLFLGHGKETDWLPMQGVDTPNGKSWAFQYVTPEGVINNQRYKVRAYTPAGKMEEVEGELAYLDVETFIEHTEKWELRRQDYNKWKGADVRGQSVFFPAEDLVLKVETETDPATRVKWVRTRIVKPDGGYLADKSGRTEFDLTAKPIQGGNGTREQWTLQSKLFSEMYGVDGLGGVLSGVQPEGGYTVEYYISQGGNPMKYTQIIRVEKGDGAFIEHRER